MTFSEGELVAMRQRAAELRAEAGGNGSAKKLQESKLCEETIAALDGLDRDIAELLHRVVADEAPHLDAKTWYGFPSYARDGKVVVFFQPASKHETRYATIGFNEEALLDEGEFWPTAYAVVALSDKFEAKLRGLVHKAAG